NRAANLAGVFTVPSPNRSRFPAQAPAVPVHRFTSTAASQNGHSYIPVGIQKDGASATPSLCGSMPQVNKSNEAQASARPERCSSCTAALPLFEGLHEKMSTMITDHFSSKKEDKLSQENSQLQT
ncbi:unnamed protein product, partial [Polarella glacialis]